MNYQEYRVFNKLCLNKNYWNMNCQDAMNYQNTRIKDIRENIFYINYTHEIYYLLLDYTQQGYSKVILKLYFTQIMEKENDLKQINKRKEELESTLYTIRITISVLEFLKRRNFTQFT
eukprot:TRINITY_DN5129_c0_g1_i2.p4 TRINITY_DN5129_c0_g1~~TRINITY_DN5129_c0_g1_i2.p4  ORF type:complete len:118 (+),score=2.02 TRINITY_DN5129_c0_g1_i2:750-1103(+)